jgi:UDP-2-acetamido-2-deoxy-ribo-hexuluronate aminotransferase
MNIPFIDLKSQYRSLEAEIGRRIKTVLEHGQYIMGPEVAELECRLADFVGVKHCITVASGTEALLISLLGLGIGRDDEVITTPFTFAATVEVIVLLGAKPVFVDVEPDTCNIDSRLIEAKITSRTKAIMPVSLYGQVADMDEINAIANRHGGIPVIEDAAQSFGATYKGRRSCGLTNVGCTSFFPSKPLGCYGDGGAIFTESDELAKIFREIRVHGQSRRYEHSRVGVGGRMDTLQCAIVLAKLTRFNWEIEQRLKLGALYNELFDKHSIQRVAQRQDRDSVFAQYTIFSEDRDNLQARLLSDGVPTAVHYPSPMNGQLPYRQYCCGDCTPVADAVSRQVMSLPMSPDLAPHLVEKIVHTVVKYNTKDSTLGV